MSSRFELDRITDIIKASEPGSEAFYEKLSPNDLETVLTIVSTIKNVSQEYNEEGNSPVAYFGVYGIGGYINKQGERPDIDLLLVTNGFWDSGYSAHEYPRDFDKWKEEDEFDYGNTPDKEIRKDWIIGSVAYRLYKDYSFNVLNPIPASYDQGAREKGVVRLTPKQSENPTKPIDLVYVKTTWQDEVESLEVFERYMDVDTNAHPLPKIPLLRIQNQGSPSLQWHW